MLVMHDCTLAANFATSSTLPSYAIVNKEKEDTPPSLEPAAPEEPPVAPAVSDKSSDVLAVDPNNLELQKAPENQDHYLCVCIGDSDDALCHESIKAACMIGHIPQSACKSAFAGPNNAAGSKDAVNQYVIGLIEGGQKCSSTKGGDTAKLSIPSSIEHVDMAYSGKTTAGDHYLCACMVKASQDAWYRCMEAAQVACTVGHLPAGDCFASFPESGETGLTEHALKIIDHSANCKNHLSDGDIVAGHWTQTDSNQHANGKAQTCPDPPCFDSENAEFEKELEKFEQETTPKLKNDLCSCLDDFNSSECENSVKAACAAGDIPKDDCDAGEKGMWVSVTRHVLRIIDHGAKCGATGALFFTNHGCHCLADWTSNAGIHMSGEDTCGDPGTSKGFPWCKTVPSEHCNGVEGSPIWDRCDNPIAPRYVPMTNGGKDSLDHYLCVCVDPLASSDMCKAAVEAACEIGHLPSVDCAESIKQDKHDKVTESIANLLAEKGGCKVGVDGVLPGLGKEELLTSSSSSSSSSSAAMVQETNVKQPESTTAATTSRGSHSSCKNGQMSNTGSCVCSLGYAGANCNRCDNGFFGYPTCREKKICMPSCVTGTCDYALGTCACSSNFAGLSCDRCAPGHVGQHCVPKHMAGSSSWSGTILFFLMMFAIVVALMWYQSEQREAKRKRHVNYFDRVPAADWEGGEDGHEMTMDGSGVNKSLPTGKVVGGRGFSHPADMNDVDSGGRVVTHKDYSGLAV